MGISFGQPFGYLVFTLANVGKGRVKKSIGSYFRYKILQVWANSPIWALQALAVAGCFRPV